MNIDINQIALILKDFKIEIESLKSKQSDLLKRVRKSIDIARLNNVKKNLDKK